MCTLAYSNHRYEVLMLHFGISIGAPNSKFNPIKLHGVQKCKWNSSSMVIYSLIGLNYKPKESTLALGSIFEICRT